MEKLIGKGLKWAAMLIILVIATFVILHKSATIPEGLKGKEISYRIFYTDREKNGKQEIVTAYATMSANSSAEQRMAVAAKVAFDLKQEKWADVFEVRVHADDQEFKGTSYGILSEAYLYSKGCGYSGKECDGIHWEISSTTQAPATDMQKAINVLWAKNRSRFQHDGVTQEDALKGFIAHQLKIEQSDVSLFSK
ncbi:DUF4875 domain-containing protein [Vibrio sp. S9_S30]|uniref:DUF4875 domain-containing protein n=1 Tax=Vibrio sp. S9_S30 TaxID=2720226 RepID=UPI001680C109|nr:DUF4875 domain-containing protein [Vibrio sp. S9_S30]MBD1559611.1 DUF4875 domain-containing protein [Vibrio sp. S9_S30]